MVAGKDNSTMANDNAPQQIDMFRERSSDDYEALLAELQAAHIEIARLKEGIITLEVELEKKHTIYNEVYFIPPETKRELLRDMRTGFIDISDSSEE